MVWRIGWRNAGRRLLRLYMAVATLACLATVCGFFARGWWVLELCCHFRVQYAVVLVLATALAAACKRYKSAALLALFTAVNVLPIVPLYFGRTTATDVGPSLRAVLLNVHTANHDSAAVLDFLQTAEAKLVVLLEVNDRWRRELQALEADYPHSRMMPREDNFGIALLSRVPWHDCRIVHLGDAGVPSIIAHMRIEDAPLTVIATHPLPPVNAEYVADRNRQLVAVAELAAEQDNAVLVLGDLNTTSFSPHFGDLLERSKLQDSRTGFGLQPTWPAQSPVTWISLDHCLVSPSMTVGNRRVGPFVGSDHYPVVVDLAL